MHYTSQIKHWILVSGYQYHLGSSQVSDPDNRSLAKFQRRQPTSKGCKSKIICRQRRLNFFISANRIHGILSICNISCDVPHHCLLKNCCSIFIHTVPNVFAGVGIASHCPRSENVDKDVIPPLKINSRWFTCKRIPGVCIKCSCPGLDPSSDLFLHRFQLINTHRNSWMCNRDWLGISVTVCVSCCISTCLQLRLVAGDQGWYLICTCRLCQQEASY